MKKQLTLLLFLLPFLSVRAQQHTCGQAEVTEQLFQQHPEWREQFRAAYASVPQTQRPKPSADKSGQAYDYLIPVVFHVLHQNGSENISDAQIQDQIRILNRDYQKDNADTANVTAAFQNNIADVRFAFALAKTDPDGKCTNGITRHVTSSTNWDANNLGLFAYSWPRDKYLNIYVVKTMNIAATAYAFLPGTPIPATADCIVTLHNMVGSIGTGTTGNSRVITHEVAHWFGIQHIWGTSNSPGVACGDDEVEDTPITKGFTSCNLTAANAGICNPGTPENVQNYMDYAPCKLMFTNGQADRMYSFATGTLNGRNNVWSEPNLVATGISGQAQACLPSVDFRTNRFRACVQTPVRFTSLTQSGGPANRLWSFAGGNPATSTDSIVEVVYGSSGSYAVSLQVSNAAGEVVETREGYIQVEEGLAQTNLPFKQDFETPNVASQVPIYNSDPNTLGWTQGPFGAEGTGQCFWLNSHGDISETPGEKDAFELPDLNLSDQQGLSFGYSYAYARPSVAQRDSFKVQYSFDCGGTWTNLPGVPGIGQMATASGGVSQSEFVPDSLDWVRHTFTSAQLAPLENQSRVRLRFLFVKDVAQFTANNLYIDQIRINSTTTSLNPIWNKRGISLFPNPSKGSFQVRIDPEIWQQIDGRLFDVQGKELPGLVQKTQPGELLVNQDEKLAKGLYLLRLSGPEPLGMQKLWVN